MANRIPRGYERNSNLTRHYLEISQGVRPAIVARPAQYLPVKVQDQYLNDWVVISAGTIVSCDPSGDLIWANGGQNHTITYTANDVGLTIDITANGRDSYVTAAATSASGLLPNKPIGVAPYDYFQNLNQGYDSASPGGLTKYTNYQIQDKVAILCDYLIELPVRGDTSAPGANDSSGVITCGDLVQPNENGAFVLWKERVFGNDESSCSGYLTSFGNPIEQIVGRCIHRSTVSVVDNLEKVQTVPGLGLSGSATSGYPQHLYDYDNDAAYSAKVLIQLMVS